MTTTNARRSVIACRARTAPDGHRWLYVGAGGILVEDQNRAERLESDLAGVRILQYLNDYPSWEFQEIILAEGK